MASAYLTRTQTAGNRRTFTVSWWIKRSALTAGAQMIGSDPDGSAGNNFAILDLKSTDALDFSGYESGHTFRLITNRLFRDTSAWYHIVFAVDTTQSTASNRMKIYVNGVQETSFSTETYPSQNYETSFNNNSYVCNVGGRSGSYFDGLMTHVNFVDGTALTPTSFGQSDSNGVWIPKPSPSVTYGTNGFFLKMDNSGNMGLDSSGNSNNFTTSGTITQAKDTPSNVFATWNKLDWGTTYFTLTNGSTTAQSNASVYTYGVSTLGVNSGKFYWEVEYDAKNGGNKFPQIGITSTQTTNTQYELGHYANDWCYYISDTTANLRNNNSNTNWGTEYVEGDIIGVALDCTNNKLYFSKNGTWQESGNPTAGSGGISITAPSSTPLGFYFPAICYYDSTHRGTFKANFGNGYFGTTAVTSAGANASGNGIFEYDVPTGYTALSTKGLDS